MQEKLLYSMDEVLRLIPMSRYSLYKAIYSAEVATIKRGRRRFISAKALADFVALMEANSGGVR